MIFIFVFQLFDMIALVQKAKTGIKFHTKQKKKKRKKKNRGCLILFLIVVKAS